MAVTRQQIIDLLWEHSYGKFRDDEIGEGYEEDEYPEYLTDQLLKLIEQSG